MNTTNDYLFDLAEAEFGSDGDDNPSFNSPSLIAVLEKLSPEAAASTVTYEGYSAWGVALHVAYYKHFIISALAGESIAGVYPFPAGTYGFGEVPASPDPVSWKEVTAYLRNIHSIQMRVLRSADPARLGETFSAWKISYGRAAAWLCSHDSYHAAQIMSMGVPGLKEKPA
jgi:uncharacterized damage-inducible protein DinB